MAAELQSSTQSPAPPNLAPLKPLLELKRGGRKPNSFIKDALKERWTDKQRRDKDSFREIFNIGQLVSLFINGDQYPMRNPVTGAWGVLPSSASRGSDQRPLNVIRGIAQNLLGKWENSSPDIVIRAARNLDSAQAAAKAADTIWNHYERQFFLDNHHFTQQEGLMGMTLGTYIERFRFDDAKLSMAVVQEVFEQKDVTMGGGVGECADCEYGGEAGEFQSPATETPDEDAAPARSTCPRCGSTAVQVDSAPTGSLYSATGQQQHPIGDIICELLPMFGCRWDLAKRPEDSSWFSYSQDIPRGMVTRILGNVLIPDGNTERNIGLDILKALESQGMAFQGRTGFGMRRSGDERDGRKGDTYTFEELWLSPEDYADINLHGEGTVSGDPLPAGKLTDTFPDGLCAVGLNGMSVILALYPEKHRDHIVSGTWFMQASTGAGRGLADTVDIQKRFNTLNNYAESYMSSTYAPAVIYNNQLITGNKMKYIGTPRTNIPVDPTKMPEGFKLSEAAHQMSPVPMPAQFFNYAQNFMGYMFKKVSMSTDYEQGEPGITASNPTATAAEIDQGNADSLNQPIFLNKGDARRRGAEITIGLFRKHFQLPRYFALTGKNGHAQSVALSAADLCADLLYEVARNSEMPKGPFARQKARAQFFAVMGGAEGFLALEQAKPKLVNDIAQEYDVDLEADEYDGVNEICLRRLRQMQSAAKMGVTDPAIIIEAINPPVSPVELGLAEKANWFARWLSEDEGLDASLSLRAACELLAQGQFHGAVQQEATVAMGAGTVAAAQGAPAAMGQAALDQQAQQPESTEPDPSAQLQYQQELTTQQHEAQQNALDREHELKVLDKEEAKDKSVATHDAKEKIRIERSKPRTVSAKSQKKS